MADQRKDGLSVPQRKRNEIKHYVKRALMSGVAELLPDHIKPGAMLSSFAGALTRDPKLLDCSPSSFVEALVLAATAALPPDGYHAHLVRYGDKVVFIPDYKGLIQLALRNGVMIDAYPVYEKDTFEYQFGTEPYIKHIPSNDELPGRLVAAYAVARFGEHRKFVVASRADVMKRKSASRASSKADSPWVKWEEAMWVKTAVKMLAKYIPRTADLMTNALNVDDAAEIGTQSQQARAIASDMLDAIGLHQETKSEVLAAEMAPKDNPKQQEREYDEDGMPIPNPDELKDI